MKNIDKYKKSFINALEIEESQLTDDLKYNDITEWDSIGHMTLIADLEETFNVTLETDDIIDFSSYEKGKEILQKYKIDF